MSTIIAAGFDTLADAEAAVERLQAAGVPLEYICTYRVNPPGEHHALPAGGDHNASPGAKHAEKGAAKGAMIGAAVGLAAGAVATPFLGPAGIAAGVGVGAYTGSLVGGLKEIEHEPQPDLDDVRPAENLVAVHLENAGVPEAKLMQLFEELNALQIERAQGAWTNGCWSDFDPASRPNVIGGRRTRGTGTAENRHSAAT